jgi:hypothetical protein
MYLIAKSCHHCCSSISAGGTNGHTDAADL